MKTYKETVVRRVGEWFPLDENYDYMAEDIYPNNPETRQKVWDKFLTCYNNPDKYLASTGFMMTVKKIVNIGMYDGWPYWKPYPSFSLLYWFGAETHSWWQINHIELVKDNSKATP